jgi:phage FluMu protein Com
LECGKVFWKKIAAHTVEVKCPKCGGFDTDVEGY